MKNDVKYQKALQAAYKYLNYRPRTEKEVTLKLREKGFSEEIIKNVINKLKYLRYLDDQEFCRMWIHHRLKLNPRCKKYLLKELIDKGVDPKVAQEILNDMVSDSDEEDVARKIILKQIKKYENKPDLNKIKMFLFRRGFPNEIIEKILLDKETLYR